MCVVTWYLCFFLCPICDCASQLLVLHSLRSSSTTSARPCTFTIIYCPLLFPFAVHALSVARSQNTILLLSSTALAEKEWATNLRRGNPQTHHLPPTQLLVLSSFRLSRLAQRWSCCLLRRLPLSLDSKQPLCLCMGFEVVMDGVGERLCGCTERLEEELL